MTVWRARERPWLTADHCPIGHATGTALLPLLLSAGRSGGRAGQPGKALNQISVRISHVPQVVQSDDCSGHRPGDPLAVAWGGQDILCPVPDQGGHGYGSRIELPRRDKGESIVGPSPYPVAGLLKRGFAHDRGQVRATQDLPVGIGQIKAVEQRRRVGDHLFPQPPVRPWQCGGQALLALKRPSPLLYVLRVHPGEELLAQRVERCHAHDAGGPADPVAEQRGYCQGVRAAAGGAVDREPPDAQMISDSGNITGSIGYSPAAGPVRAAVAGPVVADHPGAGRADKLIVRVPIQTAARRSVQRKHWMPAQVTPLGKGKCAAISRRSDLIRPVHTGERNQRPETPHKPTTPAAEAVGQAWKPGKTSSSHTLTGRIWEDSMNQGTHPEGLPA